MTPIDLRSAPESDPALALPPLHALWPNYYDEKMVSYTLKSIVKGFVDQGVRARIVAVASARTPLELRPNTLLPPWGVRYTNHLVRDPMAGVMWRARAGLKRGDIAYVWLDSNPAHVRALKARGVFVVREMINCTLQFRREAMAAAMAANGAEAYEQISDDDIAQEREALCLADAVFCPNRFVAASVQRYGVPAERCIATSYGWGRDRITTLPLRSEGGPLRVLFAGTVSVRKGVSEVLRAWEAAGIDGTLTIAGRMTSFIRDTFAHVLARPDVIQLGHVDDIDAVYAAADVFIFPSWEEGGPQVTLEAMASGLVPIATDIGSAGAYTADEDLGYLVGPGDVAGLVAALRDCAARRSELPLRRRAVSERAQRFEWARVSHARLQALRQHYKAGSA